MKKSDIREFQSIGWLAVGTMSNGFCSWFCYVMATLEFLSACNAASRNE